MSTQALKAIATGATADPFAQLLNRPVRTFDADAYHVMQERDAQLIRDNLLHGAANREFVYQFSIGDTKVAGISVIGARQLASEYKGIKQRIVASTEKRGSLFVFRTFEPLDIKTVELPALAEDVDFYEVVMEIQDVKTGNSVQVRKSEPRMERKRNGELYLRPHYDVIAESKAFRNGVLSVLPQSVIIEFEQRCLATGKGSEELTMDQLRERIVAYCTKKAVVLIRGTLAELNYGELTGLATAARTSLETFREAAQGLGIVPITDAPAATPLEAPPAGAPVDPDTGEILGKQDDELRAVEAKPAARSRKGANTAPAPTPAPASDPAAISATQLKGLLTQAGDRIELDEAADFIRTLPEAEQEEVRALYQARVQELEGQTT